MESLYLDTSDLRNIRNTPLLQQRLNDFLHRNDAGISLSEIHLGEWLIAGEVQAEEDFQWWRANFPKCSLEPSRSQWLTYGLELVAGRNPEPLGRFPKIDSVENVAAWKRLVDHSDSDILETGMQPVLEGIRRLFPEETGSVGQTSLMGPLPPAIQAFADELLAEGITQESQITEHHLRRVVSAYTSFNMDGPQMDAMMSAFTTAREAPQVNMTPISELIGFPVGDVEQLSAFMDQLANGPNELQIASLAPLFFLNHYQRTGELPKEFLANNDLWRILPIAIAQATRAARLADKRQRLAWGDVYDERHIEFGLSATWFTVDGRTYKHLKTALKKAPRDLYSVEILRTGSGLKELLSR